MGQELPNFPGPDGTPIPTQSVPTSIVRGPDGAYYVGQLTGFPFPTGGASVWRIVPGQAPTEYATGFTTINDLAFGKDGTLYVLQMTSATLIGPPTPGKLIRVPKRGARTELAPGALTSPTGLAVDDKYAYVSNKGDQAGAGEILRSRCAETLRDVEPTPPELIALASSPRWEDRCKAAERLAAYDDDVARQALLRLMNDSEDTAPVEAAAEALMRRGDEASARLIFRAMSRSATTNRTST